MVCKAEHGGPVSPGRALSKQCRPLPSCPAPLSQATPAPPHPPFPTLKDTGLCRWNGAFSPSWGQAWEENRWPGQGQCSCEVLVAEPWQACIAEATVSKLGANGPGAQGGVATHGGEWGSAGCC